MRDLHNNLDYKLAFEPKAAVTDNTAFASAVLDMLNVSAAELVLITGTDADADVTFALVVKESDTGAFGGEETDVADADLVGLEADASYTFAEDAKVRKIGIRRGAKRYKKATVTPANNTGNAFLAGVWLISPNVLPTSNPPA